MRSPFAAMTAPASGVDVDPITDRQRGYLINLLTEKYTIQGRPLATAEQDAARIADALSKTGASKRIEETAAWLNENRPERAVTTDIEDGFYELGDGRIIKVIHAVHGSGHQYGKVLNIETGKFEMAVGIVREVRATGKRIDTDQQRCAELGKLYGICMCCGLELTDETSIEVGIGPICRAKRGW